ncbi:Chia Acidic mammalian chitinase [Nymphaea thermarum]|nr:Chia Acidic mammalian chitinase [Nymphaea thermarum]
MLVCSRGMVLAVAVVVFLNLIPLSSAMAAGVRAAYWPSWTNSYAPPSSLNTTFFTHLYYAFLDMDPSTFQLIVSPSQAALLSQFTTALQGSNPPPKTLLSIGGGGASPAAYALMASNSSSRKAFIGSTISTARKYSFDGLDLDWEFPRTPQEMQSLAELLREWRLAVEEEATASGRPRLLLTAAVYFSPRFWLSNVPRDYPVGAMGENLDWVNPMCYDYHGSWDTSATGAPAALYDPRSNISTSYGIESWLRSGMPPEMIVMGLPMYGRTWTLRDAGSTGVGAAAAGVGPGNGVLIYSKVVEFNREKKATVVHDGPTASTYSYAGTAWVGYDDVASIGEKIKFALAHRLGGYFFWAVSYDDQNWTLSRQAAVTWGS